MKNQKPDKSALEKRPVNREGSGEPETVLCGVCLAQGAPCAAMTQQLFSGNAKGLECQLIAHCF